MSEIRIDPRKQFSKRLARWTAVFWYLYMSWLSTIMLMEPEAGLYCVYMAIIVTVVMVLNVWTYMNKSVAEQAIHAMIDKTRIELSLKNNPKEADSDEEGSVNDSEGESNG